MGKWYYYYCKLEALWVFVDKEASLICSLSTDTIRAAHADIDHPWQELIILRPVNSGVSRWREIKERETVWEVDRERERYTLSTTWKMK